MPLRWIGGRKVVVAGKRAATRGAPTMDGWTGGEGNRGAYEGTHKGCPYGGLGVGRWSWRVRGQPQGVPLRWMEVLGRKVVVARTRAPTRGAPTVDGGIG